MSSMSVICLSWLFLTPLWRDCAGAWHHSPRCLTFYVSFVTSVSFLCQCQCVGLPSQALPKARGKTRTKLLVESMSRLLASHSIWNAGVASIFMCLELWVDRGRSPHPSHVGGVAPALLPTPFYSTCTCGSPNIAATTC